MAFLIKKDRIQVQNYSNITLFDCDLVNGMFNACLILTFAGLLYVQCVFHAGKGKSVVMFKQGSSNVQFATKNVQAMFKQC